MNKKKLYTKVKEEYIGRERWIRYGNDVGIMRIPRADKYTLDLMELSHSSLN